ncbi:hypothetical protein C9J60_12915 [Streptomyces sp. A244]|uniref:hypothetical protein n=1 Tax=Streptomyces sp. A244 TaxID=2137016 RepID=UPI000D1AB188|nr:hypothetical protein [Streptomyces sp. A244]PTH87809.1 hypothetical protein C9J60_12915 [Streptomyces sp. A244]
MRGTVGRACTAGLVIGVLVTGLTACTGDAGGDGKAEACTDGTYAWSGVQRTQKLTEMSDPITFEKRTASYSAKLKPVDDKVYRPSVTAAPRGVGAAAVITALGRHLKVEEPLAGPSEKEPPEGGHYFEAATGDLKGDYYSWGYIRLVTADFTYTCGNGEPVKGQVLTWEGTGSGFMPCSEEPPEGVGAPAAARALCPADSRAARAAD